LLDGNDSLPAASALLAVPAPEAARLLRPLDTVVAERLAAIPYSSSLIMALGYDARAVSSLPGGFGFLVPRKETYRLRACTFVGQKFPGRVPPNRVLLRCFLGGVRDEAVLELNDAAATGLVQEELRAILGISAEPLFARVYRWRKALAQYTVGHHQRLEAIQGRLANRRGLFLCGNACQGIGIPDCIRAAKAAVDACLQELGAG
ncbi:protoporphyrinogen oxidase, partial [Acidobacteriia bacterium AH_259_A11_L15]|nr:protoporphyrinogen oxidase [Acidobacteriia bacterium AH_259_A11_L15]